MLSPNGQIYSMPKTSIDFYPSMFFFSQVSCILRLKRKQTWVWSTKK